MDFAPYKVVANDPVCDDITVVTLDGNINIQAGEYVFVWIPGVGEKPFSCLTDSPLRLAVIDVGQFTSACYQLKPGDDVYIRGPHGAPVMPKDDANIICVAGGTGLAAVYQVARDFGPTTNRHRSLPARAVPIACISLKNARISPRCTSPPMMAALDLMAA